MVSEGGAEGVQLLNTGLLVVVFIAEITHIDREEVRSILS